MKVLPHVPFERPQTNLEQNHGARTMGNRFSNVIRDEHYSRLNKKVNKTERADTQISAGQEDVMSNHQYDGDATS